MEQFLQFVADIMEVDVTELSMNTAYNEFPAWDSMMQLRLVMEIEDEYGVEIPFEKVPQIKTLQDFYQYIEG